ncbi:MAG: hypothetical protein DHS20C20_14950 [Ardenticatenaceae bacterium]|nr:MAG: hypothetical protein DHS20C20_14950 [Ardenticatenaceae bacterium]
MNVRCNYCRQSFNLSRDYIANALANSADKKQKYETVECINCRKMIKVPFAQMKRYAPQSSAEETAED